MKSIYRVELFREEGFERKRCVKCGRSFWTLDPEKKTCGDTPCDEYSFIGNPPTRRRLSLQGVEKAFLGFFKRRGHEVIKRYPVVARWRDDIFLTIASIADFQPWVTSGLVPPPANPLVVSQPSIRLKDIDNVGRSGRHLTLFHMGGHHAFNSPKRRVYWNHETVSFCHEFFTRELKISPSEITYIEDFWEGGGNAGEDFEVNIRGLEVATLVFMRYVAREGKFTKLPLSIVDTGYGLERISWLSQGSTSAYEAIFSPMIEELRKLIGVEKPPVAVLEEHCKMAGLVDIESGRDLNLLRKKVAERVGVDVEDLNRWMVPLEAVYAIADHLRCLAFMFGDGITPSNVKEGYLARLVLRRTLRLMRELGLEKSLVELMALELKFLSNPELKEHEGYILQVVELEERRYLEAISKGSRLVERVISSLRTEGKSLPVQKLFEFYDSHGLPPEIVKEIGERMGVEVNVPEDFYIRVAKMHASGGSEPVAWKKESSWIGKRLPKSRALFYENPYLREFRARVIGISGNEVVLNQTAFYPEGGGQLSDVGFLEGGGESVEVVDVQKVDGTIVHVLRSNPFRIGQVVRGVIDWERRISLMRHHSATHILLGAAKKVLGDHVWQHGAQKYPDRSRLDISHFKRISTEEVEEIERLANEVIVDNRPIRTRFMDRNEAERKYGFELYQGGVVEGKEIRVVEVKGWNTQACAGTHCRNTGEIGLLKILRTERIQDGVERLEFVVGGAALKVLQQREREMVEIASILRTRPEEMGSAVRRLFDEWKSLQKEVERLRGVVARLQLRELKNNALKIGRFYVVSEEIKDASVEDIISMVNEITREHEFVAIFGVRGEVASIVLAAGRDAVGKGVDCGRIASEAAKVLGGGGGGKKSFGQGGGPRIENLREALHIAFEKCKQILEG